MAGSEKRDQKYLFSLASRFHMHSIAGSYREVRLILKARLVKTVVDDLYNSAHLAEEDSIRGANSAMSDDDAYVWSGLGISSSWGILPFTYHLAAPSDILWTSMIQEAGVTGPAVEAKLARPGVFGMRDTDPIPVSHLLMSCSGR
jgi:hypothetical protein